PPGKLRLQPFVHASRPWLIPKCRPPAVFRQLPEASPNRRHRRLDFCGAHRPGGSSLHTSIAAKGEILGVLRKLKSPHRSRLRLSQISSCVLAPVESCLRFPPHYNSP